MFAQIHSFRIWAYLVQKHILMPNVPREINTQSVCAQTHTQKPLPVFKAFGNSIKDTRFRIYICALLCLWPRRKEPSQPSCSKELTTRPSLHAPACSTTENNIHNSDT